MCLAEVSRRGRPDRGCVARPRRWSLNWLLSKLIPTQTGPRPLCSSAKSLFCKIFPISHWESILCEDFVRPTPCFQYFASRGGRGVPPTSHQKRCTSPICYSELQGCDPQLASLAQRGYRGLQQIARSLIFVILLAMTLPLMTQQAVAQQTLTPPPAVTDPSQLQSKTVADMQNFSIEKLYMTRTMAAHHLVARRQTNRIRQ